MKNFSEIIGHNKVKEHLQSAIQMDKVPHAYIFNGESGSGKSIMAEIFAKTLECERGGIEPCNECHSCVQADSHNQPDIIWVSHEKPGTIGVGDVREQLIGDIQIKPYSSRYKIYIVKDAQKMTPQAQNAILKTIEEPPEYGIIILLTENADAFLPTILSRCVKLDMKPVKDELIQEHLIKSYHVSLSEARFAVAFAQGRVGRAQEIIDSSEFAQMKEEAMHLLRYAKEMTASELIDAVKHVGNYKQKAEDYIDLLAMWYRDVLLFKSTNDSNLLIFKDEMKLIREHASVSSYEGIELILKAMDKAKVRLKANVNFDLTMELMFMTIRENS